MGVTDKESPIVTAPEQTQPYATAGAESGLGGSRGRICRQVREAGTRFFIAAGQARPDDTVVERTAQHWVVEAGSAREVEGW